MAGKYDLREVSPSEVKYNVHNPRGENEDVIQMDKSFEQLKDSVAQFGVLVPIVVHKLDKVEGKKKYVLVDGERRLRASRAAGIKLIPAHIATTTDSMDEIIQAFHIHMLRKQWKPVASARAFSRIKKELRKKKIFKSERELLEELKIRSGCTDSQLKSLARGIKYSESVLKKVDQGAILWSHLVQFEQNFVEQLQNHYPDLLKKIGLREVRKVLVRKAEQQIINTRSLIDYVLPVVTRAKTNKEKQVAEKFLEEFIVDEKMTAKKVKVGFEKKFPPSQELVELAEKTIENSEKLYGLLVQLDVDQVIAFQKTARNIRKKLEDLRKIISKKITAFNKHLGI